MNVLLVVLNAAWAVMFVMALPAAGWLDYVVIYGFIGSMLGSLAIFYDADGGDSNWAGMIYLIGFTLWFPVLIVMFVWGAIERLTDRDS